jgi:cytochrome c oxidase assembly protein subunit 15
LLTAFATLVLICFGGLVTSHGAGMAVPDWPNTFGYNLFFFPVSKWVGGIFYEHTHRLVASGVGFLTIILAVWLWLKESRRWLRWLGVIAFFSVVLQGVLGGLRVVLFKDELGIFHAALGQLFFVLTCSIALFTSRWWLLTGPAGIHRRQVPYPITLMANTRSLPSTLADHCDLRRLFLFATILIFAQLILGATMRHQHAGLAIPDFPAAYGRVWPALNAESIARYNQNRIEVNAVNPISAFQIVLQMTHRILALVILFSVASSAWLANRRPGRDRFVAKVSGAWLGLILVQVFLGAATIWTGKSADVATAHVAVGALSLMIGVMLAILGFRGRVPLVNWERIKEPTRAMDGLEQVRTGTRTALFARSGRQSLNRADRAVRAAGQGFTQNGAGIDSNSSG